VTPLEMIAEWRKGCSCVEQIYDVPARDSAVGGYYLPRAEHPEGCQECTRALIDALERALKP
jgi:hypothetical protein